MLTSADDGVAVYSFTEVDQACRVAFEAYPESLLAALRDADAATAAATEATAAAAASAGPAPGTHPSWVFSVVFFIFIACQHTLNQRRLQQCPTPTVYVSSKLPSPHFPALHKSHTREGRRFVVYCFTAHAA